MAAVAGIVLAGGRSRRMGTDKTQLLIGGQTLVERSFLALRPHCAALFAVLGEAGPRPLPPDARQLHDEVPGEGPLRGLATGLAAARAEGFERAAVLSADVPLITAAVVGELLRSFEEHPADAVIAATATAQGEGRAHPLVGVYTTASAGQAQAALARGERAVTRFLGTLRMRKLQVSEPLALSNVNTPQEWEAVLRLVSKT